MRPPVSSERCVKKADTLRSLVEGEEYVLFAYLFGSCAKGEESVLSDMDVAAFFSTEDRSRCSELKIDLYMALSRRLGINNVDIVVLNTATNLILLEEIIRSGVLLLDRNPDLREDFEQRVIHSAIDFRTQRKALLGM
jgi:predicted nucleotidyltransferase